MAEMVWCQSCKTVVWAYDEQPVVDLRGICNMLKLPCPKCSETGNFNGWGSNHPVKTLLDMKVPDKDVYDGWSAMRWFAHTENLKWEINPDCSWFKRPDDSNLWDKYERAWESRRDI